MDIPTFSFSSFLSSSWRLNSPLYCIPSLCFLLLWSRTIVAIFDQPYSASPSPSPSTTFLHPSSLPPWLRYIPSPKNLVAILHPSMSASGHHSSINTSFFSWDVKLLSFSRHISFSVSISSALSLATSFLFPWWSTLNQLLPSLPCPSQQAFSLHFSQLTLPFSLSDRCWFPSSTTSCLLGLLSPSARGSSSLLPPRTVPSCLRASVPPLLAALVEHQQSPISGCPRLYCPIFPGVTAFPCFSLLIQSTFNSKWTSWSPSGDQRARPLQQPHFGLNVLSSSLGAATLVLFVTAGPLLRRPSHPAALFSVSFSSIQVGQSLLASLIRWCLECCELSKFGGSSWLFCWFYVNWEAC